MATETPTNLEEVERLRLFLDSVTDYAIYMLSPTGEVVTWNAGAKRFKGYEDHEIIGQHFSRFYTPEDRATNLPARALAQAASAGKFEAEGWRVRKDGTRFWAHVVIDAIHNERGDLIGFAKITRDITDRKRAQEELDKAKEALFQSQKLEAIGKLTGGVAHDFNNLLNVLTNGLSVLRQHLTDPGDIRLIDSMDKATRRGSTLTQQLLTFARKQPLHQEHRDLGNVVRAFESVLRRAVKSGVLFQLDIAPKLPLVKIDVAQFETSLLNLVVNAADATPQGGTITVFAKLRELVQSDVTQLAAGSYVSVGVRDTGVGMTADIRDRAVEPFFTTKEIGKGTGLGLSQVYGMAQQSGGTLLIESEPGEGSVVAMLFPAAADSRESDQEKRTHPETVLVVDDQHDLLDMTAELFKSLGFEVLTASRGDEALSLLHSATVDLLFTDIVMPGMTGVDLARKAKTLTPSLKVILASGYAAENHADIDEFRFLPKPYHLGDLVRTLRALG